MVARLGSNTAIVGVTLGEKGLAKANRPWLKNAHFGFDFLTSDEVKEARELSLQHQENFNIQNVGKIMECDEGLSFMCWTKMEIIGKSYRTLKVVTPIILKEIVIPAMPLLLFQAILKTIACQS